MEKTDLSKVMKLLKIFSGYEFSILDKTHIEVKHLTGFDYPFIDSSVLTYLEKKDIDFLGVKFIDNKLLLSFIEDI